jgi:HK97 family phage prohead protease
MLQICNNFIAMNSKEYTKPFALAAEVKDLDVKQGIVVGYASAFGNMDADLDVIMPGAFAKTIQEQGPKSKHPRIKHLLNHDTRQPIGNPLDLMEDTYGLKYESQVGTHSLGQDFVKMVDSGLITEHSIGFRTIKADDVTVDGNTHRQIKEVQLWEFSSLTAWGANQNTPLIGMKSLESVSDRIEKLISACRNGTFTDSTFVMLEDELKYLQKAFKELSTTKPSGPAPVTTLPDEVKGVFASFIQSL